jgi:hypothetical protein
MGYGGKIDEQNRARDLRALGWTLGEICEELGVSKASASLWCRDAEIDAEELGRRSRARHLNGNERARRRGPNRLQRAKGREIAELMTRGHQLIGDLSERDLLIAGTALYAGEGSKRDGAVVFANSDPRMVDLFMRWLRRFFDIEETRLRFWLYLHEGLDLDAATSFWSELTRIPLAQFGRPYRAVPDPSIRTSKHPMGCASIRYASTKTHRLVVGLVDGLLTSTLSLSGGEETGSSALEIGPG